MADILRFDQSHGNPEKPRGPNSGRRELLEKAGRFGLVAALAFYLRSRYMEMTADSGEAPKATGEGLQNFMDGLLAECEEGSDALAKVQPIFHRNWSAMTEEQKKRFQELGGEVPPADRHRTALQEGLEKTMR